QETAAVRHLPTPADRQRLREDVGEALLAYARAACLEAAHHTDPTRREARSRFGLQLADLAERYLGDADGSRAARLQRADLARVLGQQQEAHELEQAAGQVGLRTARDHFLVALRHVHRREFDKARPLFEEATRLDPQNFWAWYYLGNCLAEQQ